MKYVHQGFENEKFVELKRQKGREPWWKVIQLGCEVIEGARSRAGETAVVTVKAEEKEEREVYQEPFEGVKG